MSDKVQTSIPVIALLINGQSHPEFERDLELCVVDTTFSLPSMATIRVHDPYGHWANKDTFSIGVPLVIKMAPSKSMQDTPLAAVFQGEIVALEPSFSTTGLGTYTIRAYDKSHRLHYGTKSRTLLSVKESDIVSKVITGTFPPAERGSITSIATNHDYIMQNNLTDFEFLMTRAKRTGCVIAVRDGKFCFDTPEKLIATGPDLVMHRNLRQFNVRVSAALQAGEIEVRGWDITKKDVVKAVETPAQLYNKNGITDSGAALTKSKIGSNGKSSFVTYTPQTDAEAKSIAESAAGDQEGVFIEADAVAFGHPKLVAGVQVKIEKLGTKYDGKYFVTSATHIYNSSGYEVHFVVSGRFPQSFNQLLNGSTASTLEPGSIPSVVIGIVTSNKDPDNLGRVKVKFPWMVGIEGDIDSNWARVAAVGAGPKRGMYYIPEVDDEVLVAFEHGNPNRPYIIGGLWNGKDAPPEKNEEAAAQGKVNHRMLVSRSGHKIVLDDSDQKESILIMDKTENQSLLMESATGNITMKGKGDLLIEMQGNITIKSNMTINVEAVADIKMKGVNLSAESSGMYKVDSKTEVEMKATGFVQIEGTSGASLKGMGIHIEADATAQILGKPIMLN